MDILIMVISAGLTVFFLMWFILSALDLERPRYVVLGKRNIFYLIETAGIFIITIFKPKTPLDKEIANEEKEVKFLTEQKAKIDRLEHLKRKKDRLYQGVEKDAQRDDMGGYRCKQCGGTKVTGHRIIGGGYHEFCADCGTPINEMERIK